MLNFEMKRRHEGEILNKPELCFIWTFFLGKPPPSTKRPPLHTGSKADAAGFTGFLFGGRSWSVTIQECLPWSVHCPLRFFSKRCGPFTKHPIVASQAVGEEEEEEEDGSSDFYLMKFPPPISLLYLLVRSSACSVSLDRTPNSPLR